MKVSPSTILATISETDSLAEAVSLWLEAIVNGSSLKGEPAEGQDWLFQSGLYQAIQDGRVARQVKATRGDTRVLQAA